MVAIGWLGKTERSNEYSVYKIFSRCDDLVRKKSDQPFQQCAKGYAFFRRKTTQEVVFGGFKKRTGLLKEAESLGRDRHGMRAAIFRIRGASHQAALFQIIYQTHDGGAIQTHGFAQRHLPHGASRAQQPEYSQMPGFNPKRRQILIEDIQKLLQGFFKHKANPALQFIR